MNFCDIRKAIAMLGLDTIWEFHSNWLFEVHLDQCDDKSIR